MRQSRNMRERAPDYSFQLHRSLGTDTATGKRKASIDILLTKFRSKGEPKPPADDDEFRPGDTPEEAGRTLARAIIIARQL
jgi:hypothetical protein